MWTIIPNYTPLVQKNAIGDSEFTTPCATRNINQKKKSEDFIKDFKDEGKIIGEFKISVQEPSKKDDKKEKKEEGKKRKKKNKFQELYI